MNLYFLTCWDLDFGCLFHCFHYGRCWKERLNQTSANQSKLIHHTLFSLISELSLCLMTINDIVLNHGMLVYLEHSSCGSDVNLWPQQSAHLLHCVQGEAGGSGHQAPVWTDPVIQAETQTESDDVQMSTFETPEQTIKWIAQKNLHTDVIKGAAGQNETLTQITYLFSSWGCLSTVFWGPVTWILAVCLLLGGGFLPSILLPSSLTSRALHWAFDGEQRAWTSLY